MKKIILLLAISLRLSTTHPTTTALEQVEPEIDGEKSRKIIGQSVVTSVSVILNGNEEQPHFTDAVGKTVPRPFVPPHVASPINLLNPDRYEFYTFNENGELVKRLMTLREIQSIVANGNGALIGDNDQQHESSQSVLLNTIPLTNHDNSDTKVQDIVDNVQNVLSREMENNKNLSSIPHDLLDTPNVSSSWSMILPAIFGNTGDEIMPPKPINMTPETEIIDTTTSKRVASTKRPTKITTTKKTTTSVPQRQTTKLEQKISSSSSTSTTMKNKPIATKTTISTKKQTVKPKPTSPIYRSTTRRPIASNNDLPSIIKDNFNHQHHDQHDGNEETTKTVLITSRPFTQQTTSTQSTVTASSSTTRRPQTTTLKMIPKTTTRKTVKKPSAGPMHSSSSSSYVTMINKVPASALVKDSLITMIEVKPLSEEIESKTEKVTQKPSTILSTISRIPSTSQKPTTTSSSSSSTKKETLPPTIMFSTKIPTLFYTTTKRVSEYKTPSSTTISSSPTVLITTSHPITTEQHKTSAPIQLSPVKLETHTTRKPTFAPTFTTTKLIRDEFITKSTTAAPPSSTAAAAASSEEIRQDLAISQIIGSLQNDNFNLNHLFKPYDDNKKEIISTTQITLSSAENIENDMAIEKSAEDINLVPDKTFIDNQLYIEEKEPIIKDIPTTTEMPITESNESTMESDEINFERITSTSADMSSKEELEIEIPSMENSEVMQTIEKLMLEQNKSKNKIQLEKQNVLSFDDDDETEIKLASTLDSKKNLTQSKYNTKAATIASTVINTKLIHTTPSSTTSFSTTQEPISEESDTTIPTILSEALSSVIEQMLREQEFRKTTSVKPIITTRHESTTPKYEAPSTTSSTLTTTQSTSTSITKTSSEATEPSLDELNKLLHHYQELSSFDELESLSLRREENHIEEENEEKITTTDVPIEESTTVESNSNENIASKEEIEAVNIEEKSSSQNSKIYSEIDTTTTFAPEEQSTTFEPETTTEELEFSTTEDPTTHEFTTFFYVSDDNSVEQADDLGKFTTEQFVITEKRISERKTEFDTTTNVPSSEEDDDDEVAVNVASPDDLVSSVLNAIGIASNGSDEDDDDEDEEDTTSTEKISKNNNNDEIPSESDDESDEVANAISSISSTLDRTLTTDINTDFSLTSKIANSLISVADSITDTFNEGSENESDESTDSLIPSTTEFNLEKTLDDKFTTTEVDELTTITTLQPEMTTFPESILTTLVTQNKKIRPRFPVKNNKQAEKDSSSPSIQLSIIRKEDSLEAMDMVTLPPVPFTASSKVAESEEGNFIKIESIEVATTTTAIPKLSGFKNKTHDAVESVKPIFIRTPTTVKSSSLPDIVVPPSQATLASSVSQIDDEKQTERVPLIEKATKETVTTFETPSMMASDENLIQIQVQTKAPMTDHRIITSTLSNIQNIKNTIKNQQFIARPVSAPIDLSASPEEKSGLVASTAHLTSDLSDFSKLCNELAFTFWKSITADGISQSRSVVISPFALTSTLSMIFLGARGQTSGEMNDLLHLDDTITFNPHVVFRNISESMEQSRNSGIAAAAFARELYSDRSKGKLLPYFKEKAQQFYGAHVEEVNFNVINDILRRRTNLLVKRHTYNKIKEYLKTNNIWVNEPLAAVSANVFMTDCSGTTNSDRDGEMFFQVSPAIRQRRLIPIPAVIYRNGFTAGYDPILDATAVEIGNDLQSTILVMPGQQGSLIPGDNLERLESAFLDSSNDAWTRLLGTFMERPGLEVQIPRFSHRSLINTTYALQQMGLKDIFDSNKADLRGFTGAATNDLYFSDLIQINQFTTCGEDKIGDSHHIEIYPSPALKRDFIDEKEDAKLEMASVDATNTQNKPLFYDPIYDSRYMHVPLSLRPRQARLPENPRLRFDRPFLYFVRHNPTGIILFMGRFNPRLLP